MRRHAVHVREKTSIGPWLRSFEVVPIPFEIERTKYETAAELLQREADFQTKMKTLRSQGGLNKVLAWPSPDHSAIGKLGGGIRPMSDNARKRMLSGVGLSNDARNRHKLGSAKGVEISKTVPKTYTDDYLKVLSTAGKLGRSRMKYEDVVRAARIGNIVGNHNRWHVRRGIVKKGCSECERVGL